ncbi:MAG TPA: protoporphyrinogen oxidase [Candidatus Acidoferrales bacterium]|nr:protoporphyrinogen oxidase [Candidatus Acidoferrales bacterium]
MAESKCVAVIGAGISGLACAYSLQQMGVPVTLFEAEERAGGLIGTTARDGFLFESGPQSFQATEPILGLIRELGIENELCTADPKAPRFVLRHGRLQKIPMSPQAVLTSSLLGVGARWKVASEAFRRTKPPSEEETVANFVRRKFGHEILEYLVAPFVSGVYAGDPEKLSLRAAFPSLEEWEREHGSIVRGAMKSRQAKATGPPSLCSFRPGVGALTHAIVQKLGDNIRLRTRVNALRCGSPASDACGRFEVHAVQDGRAETFVAQAVVMATPAYTASNLVKPVSAAIARTLSGISYAGVAVVAAGYYAPQIALPLQGFGVLLPRSEGLHTLGTVWNSSLFPGRAPEGTFAITSFIGGVTAPEIMEKSDEEIATLVQNDVARILEITGPPMASAVWKHPKALPQYNLGHGHIVQAIRDAKSEHPGIFFCGNYLEGPSLGKCIENGFNTAAAVQDFLHAPR